MTHGLLYFETCASRDAMLSYPGTRLQFFDLGMKPAFSDAFACVDWRFNTEATHRHAAVVECGCSCMRLHFICRTISLNHSPLSTKCQIGWGFLPIPLLGSVTVHDLRSVAHCIPTLS